jgi:hypothetical protein
MTLNKNMQRMEASRFDPRQIERHQRLPPTADDWRWAEV